MLKKAIMVTPKLKEDSLDNEVYANFSNRPISDLKFICKIPEKAISYHLTNYLKENDLTLQSAYKTFHSTETDLIKVHNGIVSAIDNERCVILLLLDLSAGFDAVDHEILANRLSSKFGIHGKALQWFKSYHENRKQITHVKEARLYRSCS